MIAKILLPLLAIAATAAAPAASAGAADTGDTSGQVLVMLRLPAAHFRPDGNYDHTYGDALSRSAMQRQAHRIASRHRLRVVSDWPMPMLGIDCVVMRPLAGTSLDAVADTLSREPEVAWSQPMHAYRTLGNWTAHADPLYAAQPARTLWQLDKVHRLATGRGVTVAVIDSGIDARHPDLAGQLIDNRNFVTGKAFAAEQHGTAIAGIIAARADNGVGIIGIAPDARLLGLRACWQSDAASPVALCDSLSLAKALQHAIERKAPVINLSLSGPRDRLLAALIDIGTARGTSVVGAYDRSLADGGFPASQPGVIAVSDSAVSGTTRSIYVAPGRDIPAPQPGGTWALVNGSSYAAAHVSGLMALILERRGVAGKPLPLVSGTGGTIDALATLQAEGVKCDEGCTAPVTAAVGK